MDVIGIPGAIGTIIGLVRAVPQPARLLQVGRADGVPPDTAATSAVVSSG